MDETLTRPGTDLDPASTVNGQKQVASIPFALFAPYNEGVQLIGDFSNWEPVEMTRVDGGWWHTDIELPDGEYRYKFRVRSLSPWSLDQWVDVGDPRAREVDAMQGEASVLRIVDGHIRLDDYEWRYDSAHLPLDDDLVLYELHVGNFSGAEGEIGTFNGVLEKLDYLTGLGVNAIELMPVADFPGDISWGYNPRFPFAPEWAYGSPADLKRLIDECHARGIRVILDMVWNHTDTDCPLAQIDHNYWYHPENPDEAANQFGPKFNYSHWDENLGINPAREFALECMFHWIDTYHIDGIRFDATYLIRDFNVMQWWRERIKSKVDFKPFILIAEHIPPDPAICHPNGPMDAAWHETFMWQVQAIVRGVEVNGKQPNDLDGLQEVLDPTREGYSGAVNVINYTTTHDHEHVLHELGQQGEFGPEAFRKVKLARGLLLTAPGLPMLWMGDEFGEFNEKTLEARKLHWELLANDHNSDLFNYSSGLIYLRKICSALNTTNSNIEFIHRDDERQILAFKRWDDSGCIAVVVANLSDKFHGEVEIGNWPGDGQWHEWTNDYHIQVADGTHRDQLAEYELKVYVNQ
jgi:1,4-alpha-glucan branching enzyme